MVEALEGGEEDRGRSKLLTDTRLFGNSALRRIKIARAIAEAVTPFGEVKVLRADKANPSELSSIDFLIVGSPTHAGRATRALKSSSRKSPQMLSKTSA